MQTWNPHLHIFVPNLFDGRQVLPARRNCPTTNQLPIDLELECFSNGLRIGARATTVNNQFRTNLPAERKACPLT